MHPPSSGGCTSRRMSDGTPGSRSSIWASTSERCSGRSSPVRSRRRSIGTSGSRALMFVGLAFVLLMPAGAAAQGGLKVSPLWLVGAYFIEELGEVCLYPVGLSVVTKLAPAQIVGLMMGVFFLSNAL